MSFFFCFLTCQRLTLFTSSLGVVGASSVNQWPLNAFVVLVFRYSEETDKSRWCVSYTELYSLIW